jgi:hypothetical protein
MTLDRSGSKLVVAQDNADQVAAIGTSNQVIVKVDARAPEACWLAHTTAAIRATATPAPQPSR